MFKKLKEGASAFPLDLHHEGHVLLFLLDYLLFICV